MDHSGKETSLSTPHLMRNATTATAHCSLGLLPISASPLRLDSRLPLMPYTVVAGYWGVLAIYLLPLDEFAVLLHACRSCKSCRSCRDGGRYKFLRHWRWARKRRTVAMATLRCLELTLCPSRSWPRSRSPSCSL